MTTKILTMKTIHAYRLSFALLILFNAVILAQEKDSRQNADTTGTIPNSGSAAELNYKLNLPFSGKSFFIPPSSALLSDSTSIMLRTHLLLGEIISEDPIKTNFRSSILNPLHQQYVESQSMKELKYILGMIQTGAVGYLAYQHLKKYGFLKRK